MDKYIITKDHLDILKEYLETEDSDELRFKVFDNFVEIESHTLIGELQKEREKLLGEVYDKLCSRIESMEESRAIQIDFVIQEVIKSFGSIKQEEPTLSEVIKIESLEVTCPKSHYPCFDCPGMQHYFPGCKNNCGTLMRYYQGCKK